MQHSWMSLLSISPVIQNATFVDFREAAHFNDLIGGCLRLSSHLGTSLEATELKHRGRGVPSLALGGDHTISIGTFMGIKARQHKTRLVWVDAHPDINTPFTSTSGNCHGMPVAYLLGLVDWFKMKEPGLQPHEVCYIGLRSIDPAEEERLVDLEAAGGLVYKATDVKAYGIEAILEDIAEKWGPASTASGTFEHHYHIFKAVF